VATGFLIGVLSNLGNIHNAFFPKEKPLYLNLSAIKSNGKWLLFHPDNNGIVRDIAIWMEQHNPNDEPIEIQIVGGSMQFLFSDRNMGWARSTIPFQNPVLLGPMQTQIATGYLLVKPIPGNSKLYNTLIDGNSYILVDTNVRFHRVNSRNWYTMNIKYTLNGKGWNLISRNLVEGQQK
jgi:hypothetical protein